MKLKSPSCDCLDDEMIMIGHLVNSILCSRTTLPGCALELHDLMINAAVIRK
jgi:hypothetical protein